MKYKQRKNNFILSFLIIFLIIFNVSSLNIPTDNSLYDTSVNYFSEIHTELKLPPYLQTGFGMGFNTSYDKALLVNDARKSWELLCTEIENASSSINIETYIIRKDDSGNLLKDIFIRKAHEGVEVRLLYDSLGSLTTSQAYFNELRDNGIKVFPYNPLLKSFIQGRFSNRLHRKIIIIDGRTAFIGGQNIGDEYLGKDQDIGYWKDSGIFLSGKCVASLQQIFFNDWFMACMEKITDTKYYPTALAESDQPIKIILGGPDSRSTDISHSFINLLSRSKKNVYIISPYFVPDNKLLQALYACAERGIDVQIILPAKSDHPIAQTIMPYYISKLMKKGIKVFAYHNGFIHSKIIIIDGEIASIGTANMDIISFRRSHELLAILNDKEIINQLVIDFNNDLLASTPYQKT